MSEKVKKSNNSSKFAGFLAMSFFAVTGVFYMLFSSAATPGTPAFGLYLSPSTTSVTAGSNIDVKVYANLGSNAVQSIAAFIHYDPAKLQLTAANQAGIDPNYTITTRCTSVDGCQTAGNAVFVAGYSGTGSITAADGLLIGNMTFKALTSGSANVTLDSDTKLSGFTSPTISQSTLDSRTLANATYTITSSGGTTGGGTTGGGTTGGGTTGGGTTSSTTTKSTTSKSSTSTTTKASGSTTTPTSTSTTTPTTTPTDPTSTPVDTQEVTTVPETAPAATTSTKPAKKTSKALILAASMAASAVIVGALALLLSHPVRSKISGLFGGGNNGYYTPNDPLVMGGPGSGTGVVSPPASINGPKDPTENIVIKPTNTPETPSNPSSSSSSSDDTGHSVEYKS